MAYPAISVGGDEDEPGVFVGVLPGDQLPERLPGHPECSEEADPQRDRIDGDRSVTVVHSDCPGVVVERVDPGDDQPAAVGTGPQRRPRDRKHRPRQHRHARHVSADGS